MKEMNYCPNCGHSLKDDGDGADKENSAEDRGEGLADAVVNQMKENSMKGKKGSC